MPKAKEMLTDIIWQNFVIGTIGLIGPEGTYHTILIYYSGDGPSWNMPIATAIIAKRSYKNGFREGE